MWSALMNGAGLQGGGGGGGYVQSQGWEFVPRSRIEKADRGRGKNRSPLRRISSPPTVFSHIQEPPIGASQTTGEGGAGTQQLEVLRGQMWPGPEPQQQQQMQQQQMQHIRLKKKLEDLKKRHVQDKEEWMREKESLLRQVADIQGGENRRILLDLKTVLEEVQAEVKKEEEKRSELQLQYTRDRCAWELEKAELKCRIAQLEAREARGLGSGGLQSAAGLGSVTSQSPRESNSETSTLRREREEQRRILADTHSTAMDLRCRLDHNERDWLREKAELLERFDVERREWECQLKDMQKKIEELCCEVRSSRGGPALDSMKQDDDAVHRLSMRSTSMRSTSTRSTSTGSSLLSDNSRSDLLSSSTPSEPTRNPPSPGLGLNRNISADGDSPCGFNVDVRFSQSDPLQPELLVETRSRETWKQDSLGDNKKAGGTPELEAFYCGAPDSGMPQEYVSIGSDKGLQGIPPESPLWARLSYGSDKKKNTTALNAALKEIARVSEELCSYQDEIRKKSGDKRNQSESLCPSEGCEKSFLQVEEAPCDLSQIYDDLRALQRENWITLSPESTWRANKSSSDTWMTNTSDQYRYRDSETSPEESSDMETAAPPIPPRTSSWNLNSSNPDTELHIPESPMATMRKCHSPSVLLDRKCNSPSIVRKFEAMLQENEGKVFKDGMLTSCSIPSNSICNTGCCHNRWSCDASKLTHNKQLAYGTVQKSFSEVNILTAGKDLCPEKNSDVGKVQVFPVIQEFPVDSVSQGIQSLSPSLQGSRRNLMLERKTAEFNRTLFQAEMGRGVDVQETCFEACQPVFGTSSHILPPKDATTPSMCSDVSTDITDSYFKASPPPSISTSTKQNTESEPVQMRCASKETPSVLSLEEPHPGFKEAPKPSQSEVKHKLQKTGSFSRKSQQRATHEPPSSVITQPDESVESSNSNRENPHETKPQPARGSVSPLQPSVESKKRHVAQPRQRSDSPHQPESSRPVPRIMNEHPWKPLTLAAYPRPEGSRSNYGAVERILKNYESAARAQQNEMVSNPTELDMLDMDPLPLSPTLRHMHTLPTAQVSLHSVNEVQLKVQSPRSSSSISSSSSIIIMVLCALNTQLLRSSSCCALMARLQTSGRRRCCLYSSTQGFNQEEIRQKLRAFPGGSVDLLKQDSGVAVLTINNPARMNAFSGSMMVDLEEKVSQLENWTEGKGLVVRGAAETFCSGSDLNAVRAISSPQDGMKMCMFMQDALTRLLRLPLVSVALVEGRALGGGAELTTACDFRLMATGSVIQFVHKHMGLVPGWGGAARLVHIVGSQNALKLLGGAVKVDPERGLDVGLADGVLEADEDTPGAGTPVQQAEDWLRRYTEGPVPVIQAVKKVVLAGRELPLLEALRMEKEVFGTVWGAPANLQALASKSKHK